MQHSSLCDAPSTFIQTLDVDVLESKWDIFNKAVLTTAFAKYNNYHGKQLTTQYIIFLFLRIMSSCKMVADEAKDIASRWLMIRMLPTSSGDLKTEVRVREEGKDQRIKVGAITICQGWVVITLVTDPRTIIAGCIWLVGSRYFGSGRWIQQSFPEQFGLDFLDNS